MSEEHRRKLSIRAKGREGVWLGKKHSRSMLLQNMRNHIRYEVTLSWLEGFADVERLKYLNSCLRRSERFPSSSEWYKAFIEKFYHDPQFLAIYSKWLQNAKCRWLRPTIDHITPKTLGGTSEIDNLQFLPWFENRAKCDMTPCEWSKLRSNIYFYLV